MTDLNHLIDLVEKGSIARSDLDAFVPVFGLTTRTNDALDAYRGSLEGAERLFNVVLPEYGCAMNYENGLCRVYGAGIDGAVGATIKGNLARAWLLSTLKGMEKVRK